MSNFRRNSSASPLSTDFQPSHFLYLLTAGGFALRLLRFSFQPLWGDEGWSFYFAGQSLARMVELTSIDIHPPFYYALLMAQLAWSGVSAESGRFLSIIISTLLIPLLYIAGRFLSGKAAGLAAAFIGALAPFAVYYSQEVRMYSLVALLSLAATLFLAQALERQTKERPAKRLWLAYAFCMLLALYSMYYTALLLPFHLLWLIWQSRSRGQPLRHYWRPFFLSLAAVFAGYLPWLIYAAPRLLAYLASKKTAENYLSLDILSYLARHFSAFSVGQVSASRTGLSWLSLFILLAIAAGLYLEYRGKQGRIPRKDSTIFLCFFLLIPLLVGWLINLRYPFNPPYFERTMILCAPALWLLLGKSLAAIFRCCRPYIAGMILTGCSALMFAGLFDFYTVPRYPQDDYRPLLKEIQYIATPVDTLLASYQWQWGYYYAYLPAPRPKIAVVPGWGADWASRPPQMQADLSRFLQESPRLWFPSHQALGRIWEGRAEEYLASNAYIARQDFYGKNTKLILASGGVEAMTPSPRLPIDFEGALLAGNAAIGAGPFQAGRDIIPISIEWKKQVEITNDPRVSLRLAGDDGRTWASRDGYPGGGLQSFSRLSPGEELADRHGFLLPPGTPPGRYRLLLSLHPEGSDTPLNIIDAVGQPLGVEALLGEITVTPPSPPISPASLPIEVSRPAQFGDELHFWGYSLGRRRFEAGEDLDLSLFWSADQDIGRDFIVFVQLQDAQKHPVALIEEPPIYASRFWHKGFILRDRHRLHIPAGVPAGEYHLVMGLLGEDKQRLRPDTGGDQLELTKLEITSRLRAYNPPAMPIELDAVYGDLARLSGLALPKTELTAGEALPVTLYWQALNSTDRQYSVFIHLLDAKGGIVAQADQIPGAGAYPTSGWLPGEFITDDYELIIRPGTPPGSYTLEIGLYQPADGARLPLTLDGRSAGDSLRLSEEPVSIR